MSYSLWQDNGDVSGISDLEHVLTEMIETDAGTSLILDKNIRVKSKGGKQIVCIRENLTRLQSPKFTFKDINSKQFEVSLAKPPDPFDAPDQPLEDNDDLTEMQKHTKKRGGKKYKIHMHPKKSRKGKNPLLSPESLTPRELHNITGLDPLSYWTIVEVMATKTNIEQFTGMAAALVVLLLR